MSSAPVSRGFLLERLSDAGGRSQPEEVHLIDRHPKPFIKTDVTWRIGAVRRERRAIKQERTSA
jgi:hypothetical protein